MIAAVRTCTRQCSRPTWLGIGLEIGLGLGIGLGMGLGIGLEAVLEAHRAQRRKCREGADHRGVQPTERVARRHHLQHSQRAGGMCPVEQRHTQHLKRFAAVHVHVDCVGLVAPQPRTRDRLPPRTAQRARAQLRAVPLYTVASLREARRPLERRVRRPLLG